MEAPDGAFQGRAALVLLMVAIDMLRAQRSAVQETAEGTAAGITKDASQSRLSPCPCWPVQAPLLWLFCSTRRRVRFRTN